MRLLRSLLYLLPQLWATLCEGPSTVDFPFAPSEVPSNFRGRVTIEPDLCRGCGVCVRDCPAFALELEKEGRERFRLIYHPRRCVFCGQCEETCRFGAIWQTNEFVEPSVGRRPSREILVDRRPDEKLDCAVDENSRAGE
jgi:formate hydrogenlyase subunit 6/NADH:ubiquinone oxidoreductase subunit I